MWALRQDERAERIPRSSKLKIIPEEGPQAELFRKLDSSLDIIVDFLYQQHKGNTFGYEVFEQVFESCVKQLFVEASAPVDKNLFYNLLFAHPRLQRGQGKDREGNYYSIKKSSGPEYNDPTLPIEQRLELLVQSRGPKTVDLKWITTTLFDEQQPTPEELGALHEAMQKSQSVRRLEMSGIWVLVPNDAAWTELERAAEAAGEVIRALCEEGCSSLTIADFAWKAQNMGLSNDRHERGLIIGYCLASPIVHEDPNRKGVYSIIDPNDTFERSIRTTLGQKPKKPRRIR